MFRLKKWQKPITKRSGLCGKYTNTYVYDMLPKGVLAELRKKNPKNESGNRIKRHHQWLTKDVGNNHLGRQLDIIITLMKISNNWGEFERHFARRFPVKNQQLELLEINPKSKEA